MTELIYDESFEGLLSSIFSVFEQKLESVKIVKKSVADLALFSQKIPVETDYKKADRLLKALKAKTQKNYYQFFYAFHNDRDHVENILLAYCQHVFNSTQSRGGDYSNSTVLKVAQLAKSVGREKHRMEAFVRFRLTKDEIYFASIEPDFDVLPLIKRHFQERYGDQKFIIYDLKRNYGIYYDLNDAQPIQLTFKKRKTAILSTSPELFTSEEIEFQQLWARYFKSTTIESRKNMKLHLQHVPRRYWKYLSEKQF